MKTVELILMRENFHETATLGRIFNSSNSEMSGALMQVCYTLEDTDRGLTSEMNIDDLKAKKVYGKTAIPYGRYRVIKSMSFHFKRVMPHLLDVPAYEGILCHGGNKAEDSLGCILCAHTQNVANDSIQGKAEDSIMEILDAAEISGSEVWITIKNDITNPS